MGQTSTQHYLVQHLNIMVQRYSIFLIPDLPGAGSDRLVLRR